jgi:N-acetyl-anhydromuramyl-L-alanine amidase AmpD
MGDKDNDTNATLEGKRRGRVFKGKGHVADGLFTRDPGSTIDAPNSTFDMGFSTPPVTAFEDRLFAEGTAGLASLSDNFTIDWKPAHPNNHFTGRNGLRPIAIVDHIMAGSLNATTGWFANPKSEASTHFGVGKDGRIHQYVRVENGAYGNGTVNKSDLSVPWIAECVSKKINPNFVTISIEHEGQTGETFTEQMYQATLWLHRFLIQNFNIPVSRQNIVGHNQIDNVNRSFCPGKGFPWERLMTDLGAKEAGTGVNPKITSPNPQGDEDVEGRVVSNFGPGTVNSAGSYIRKRPGFGPEAPVLRKLDKGTVLSFKAYSDAGPTFQGGNRWYHIADKDNGGWIHSKLIS